ncbi:defender against death DAD protein [Nemania serpens]|nr:defender against death DAD protein [Nemania serpens]
MAPKKPATASGPAAAAATSTSTSSTSKSSTSSQIDKIALNIVQHYQKTTPQRTKLIDAFMAFLIIVGGLQFAYCVLAGNYVRPSRLLAPRTPGAEGHQTSIQPFNAFLSGFSATVGQFVLTASLRIQTAGANKSEFPSVSPERAFADYVVGSLILHFFCINFIN